MLEWPLVSAEVASGSSARQETASERLLRYMRMGTLSLPTLPPLALYVHLPWCLKKCPYCDFNSHEWAARSDQRGTPLPEAAYLEALQADLEASLPLIWGRRIHSIFIGGGTPSLFAPASIDRLLSMLRALLLIEPDAEITLEANPGTFERERFWAYRQAGVTRLSVGVQTFSDEHLRALGRVHNGGQAVAAVEEAAAAFETFNIDLMYGLPGQTLEGLEADLQQVLTLQAPHVSLYHLTIEPNTYFAQHPPVLPNEDRAAEMLDHLVARLASEGLERYEVSAFALDKHRCAHNLNYWRFGDYLGIGAGAHSKLSYPHRVIRQVRYRDPQRYMKQARSGQPLAQDDEVARADLPFEFMMNALRLREGFERSLFTQRTGLPTSLVQPELEQAVTRGWLLIQGSGETEFVRPTEQGFDFLNDVVSLFLP